MADGRGSRAVDPDSDRMGAGMRKLFLIQCPISRVNDTDLAYHTVAIYCGYEDRAIHAVFRRWAEWIAKYRNNYPRALGIPWEINIAAEKLKLEVRFISQRFGSDLWVWLKPSGIEGMPLRDLELKFFLTGIETETVEVGEEIKP